MERNGFSDLKFMLEHPWSLNLRFIYFFSFAKPSYVSRIRRESRDSADIRLPASSHLSDFRTVQKHSSTLCRGTTPPRFSADPWRSSILLFSSRSLPPTLSSSFRGRRWKRWLRGTEKLIISDTNLSGLLGGW